MRNKKLFIIVLFILVAIAVDANTLYTYNNAKPESISDNEGLNNSPINYIYQDSIGYLWFATKTNLLKYDGETIVNYLEKSTNFPTKNIIFITSKNSKLYFVTNYNIDILDSRNNKLKTFYYNKYFKNKGKPSLIVSCFIDKKNNLWVATKSGLYKSIKEKGQISNFKLITLDKKHPSLFITKLCQDKYDNIWIGTNIGVYIYNEKIDKAINIEDYYWQIQPYMVSNIKKDNKGNIWIGQTKRIIKFDNSHNYFSEKDIQPSIYFLPDNNTYNYVIDFSFDKNGNLWVLKPHMVNVIEFNKKSYKTHTLLGNQDNSSSYDLASLMIDKQGLVYIGSNEGDITLYNPYSNTIKTKYPNNYYGSFNINCACKDYKGNIWLGVDDNKLFYYISKEDRFIELKFNNDFIIRNIFETKKHEIFFTSMSNNLYKGGLFKIKNTESFYKTYNKEILLLKLYNSSNIEKIDNKFNLAYFATQDYDGSLWYISINGGTYHLNYKNGEITLIDNFNTNNYNKHKLENVIGENINLLSDSSLFISSSLYNMIKYNRNNNTFQNCYLLNKYMYINNINGFNFSYLDKKEKHWFGTDGGGLIQYHKNDSTHYTIFNKNNGFISNNINSLVVDKNNKMWIGTADGITVLDTSKNIYRINKKDGLRNEFINIFSSFSLNDSIICFGGRGGINLINTNTILNKINNTNSSIGISSIKNNGLDYFSNSKRRAISNPNKISTLYIKSSDNITINISTLSFSYPKENSITYRLLPKYNMVLPIFRHLVFLLKLFQVSFKQLFDIELQDLNY